MLWRSNTSLRSRWLDKAVLILASVAPLGLAAQEHDGARRVPASPAELRLSYAPVVQRAAPAVVHVYALPPIGTPPAFGQPLTHAIVSAAARPQVAITDYQFLIQTDAAINPGNS